jgi:hypothetical protein
MARGEYEGLSASAPEFRALFTRKALLESEWYATRLVTKQRRDVALWRRHAAALDNAGSLRRQKPALFRERAELIEHELARVGLPEYLAELSGTLGADPFEGQEQATRQLPTAVE